MKRELIPYNVMRHADWDLAPRDPVTVGGAILSGLGAGGLAGASAIFGLTTVGAIVGYVAVTAVTSWALQALAPKPDLGRFGTSSAGLLVNDRNGIAPQDFIYGEVRKGGTVVYDETTGTNNKFLHRVIALAGHEVEEIGDIYINDEIVTIDDETNLVDSGPFAGKIRINKHLGDQTTADANLLAESDQIDASFVGNGIAYIYARFEYDQDVFANGLPLITAKVKGKKVFDPRDDTTAYSNNAALCLRDFLTAAYGLQDSDIDEAAFQIAANECDEDVRLAKTEAAGSFVVGQRYEIKTVGDTDFTAIGASANTVGTFFTATGIGSGTGTAYEAEPKYTMNGVVRSDKNFGDVLQQMTTCCTGTLFWGMGAWDLVAGAYSAPVLDFTLDDLRGPISVDPLTNLRDAFNAVSGTFNDADEDYITVDYPTITSSVFEAEDGGERLPLDLELPFTTSAATAQRIAKLTLFRAREQISMSADFSLKAFNVEVGDIITFTNERYGWDQKQFEVVGWNLNIGESAGISVRLDLQETSEAAYDWNAEETAIIANNSSLLSYTDVPTLGIPADQIVPSLRVVREKLTEVISINITTGRPEAVDRVEVQFQEFSDTEWKSLGSGGLGTYEAVDLPPGEYRFRARAINSFGYFGEFTTSGTVQTAGSAEPPQDVDGMFYEVSEGTTTLEWEPVPDLDLSFYRIRHAVEITGATWANATTAVDKVPRPGTSVALPTRPGTYLIRAYDKTGIASENYTSVVVSSDEVPSFSQSLSQQEDTTFSGTKTGCEVVGGELRITDPSSGPSEATYDFSDYIETHDSTARRVRARVDAAVLRLDESAGLFDDAPGLFTDAPGLFDDLGGDAQFADTNLLFYISTTPDDPTGTPTWSPYKQFRAGEFYGRAFRFRVVLKSTSDNVTPSITALSAIVEYN